MLDEDAALAGLNAQLTGARARLIERGRIGTAEPILILHADLPLATPGAIEALVAISPASTPRRWSRAATAARTRCWSGPRVAWRSPMGRAAPREHERAARDAGLAVAWQESPALALDLDTPADMLALLNDAGGVRSPAGRLLSTFDLRAKLEAGR